MNTKVLPRNCYVQDYNPRLMQHMTYSNNITDPAMNYETEANYEIDRQFLQVSSHHRDKALYPDAGHFKIKLPAPYYDVMAVELVGGSLPNQGGLTNNPYIYLDMEELNHVKTLDGNEYFGIVNVFNHISGAFVTLDRTSTDGKPALFHPVKPRLSELSIKLLYPDGSQVLFGNETPGAPSDFSKQLSFIFEIRQRIRRRGGMDKDARTVPPMI